MSIKASSALSILAIWATMIPAIIAQPDAWWSLVFAVLATGAVGVSAWRRLGISRLIAISGAWLGTAVAIAANEGTAWIAVFAFLTTAAVVYSRIRRDAWLGGLGIAVAWVLIGAATVAHDGDGAWVSVFAFLTAGAVANSGGGMVRGASAVLWWSLAGLLMLLVGGWTFLLAILAFLLTTASVGLSDFQVPRRIEWDLFDSDEGPDERPSRSERYQ